MKTVDNVMRKVLKAVARLVTVSMHDRSDSVACGCIILVPFRGRSTAYASKHQLWPCRFRRKDVLIDIRNIGSEHSTEHWLISTYIHLHLDARHVLASKFDTES